MCVCVCVCVCVCGSPAVVVDPVLAMAISIKKIFKKSSGSQGKSSG